MKPGYSLAQIGLHWLVALLVPVQYLTGGSIERTNPPRRPHGMTPAYWDVVQHHLHNYSGMAIGLLMGVRLVLRLLQPPETSVPRSWSGRAAAALHHAFYAAIIGQAFMGIVASYDLISPSRWHLNKGHTQVLASLVRI
ncbi:hypothetical protein HFO23_31760 [Rhizobium laguerreae]|nr:hypothetical protein [Rhizobium laguerreae]